MSVGRRALAVRRRFLGPERVVTSDRVAALGRSRKIGLRGRSRAGALLLRELGFGPPRRARIAVGGTHIELGNGGDFPIDWKAFTEIFADEQYAAEYGGAHVLDIGGHKGYFGAYALASGASVVLSFEPEDRNFRALESAARPLGDRWLTRNAALSATAGTGTLLLDRTSWAHSLMQVDQPDGLQTVAIATLEQALSELPPGGASTIVKIDAEGSECEILARPEPLERVDVLMVEWHPSVAPCQEAELKAGVESSGLALVEHAGGVMRFTRF